MAISINALAFLLGALAAFLLLSRRSKEFSNRTIRSISRITEGDLSGTRESQDAKRGKGRSGLADSIAALADKLSGEMNARREIGQGLYSVGNELEQEMRKAATVVKGIAAGAEAVDDRVTDLSAGIEETSTTIKRILENLDRQNALIESQAAAVGQTASAVEQMISNSRAISRNTTQMDGSFGELLGALKAGDEKLDAMVRKTSEISRESDDLEGANAIISSIASKTNLLAMNAAIEAAHAGDSGRGFAVVSQEIRKLAESAAAQTKQIESTIKSIRSGIAELDKDSADTDRAFGTVKELVTGLSSLEAEIKNAMDEQDVGSRSIMESTGSLRKITGDVRQGSEEMISGSRAIDSEMARLIQGNMRVIETIKEIAKNTGHMEITVETVKEMSSRNKKLSDSLYAGVLAYRTGETILRLGHSQAKTHSRHQSAEKLAAWVEEKSRGAVRVEIFPAEMLGSEMKMTQDAAAGAIDMVISPTQVEFAPLMGLFELPFLFSSFRQVGSALGGEALEEMAAGLPGKGLRALAFWESGFVQITNDVRQIRVPGDMSGLRIRTGENEMTALTLKALGAVPVPLPFADTYDALASGEIDGQENPIANIEGARLYEVQKYLSVLNYKNAFATVMISERAWQALPAEHRAMLREGARGLMDEHLQLIERNQAAALERMERNGMDIAYPQAEPFRAAVQSVYDEAAARFGREWVDRVVAESSK